MTSGSPAAAPSVPAAMPNAPKSTDLVTTAFFAVRWRLEGDDFDLVAGRDELVVEIRRDRMDQLQRAGADDDRLISAQDGRCAEQARSDACT